MVLRAVAGVFLLGGSLLAAQLSGKVQAMGRPIPGATLTATQGEQKASTISDENGQYLLENVSPGVWVVEVEMFGFATARREVTVGNANSTVEWTLEWKTRAAATGRTGPAATEQAVTPSENESPTTPREVLPVESTDANEAFLVSGSLSRGLGERPPEGPFGPFGQFGPPGAIAGERPFPGQQGGEERNSTPGFGTERGPGGGPPGMARGGGPPGSPGSFGGGRFGGGGGGPGGPGMRGGDRGFSGSRGRPPFDSARFGNRRNRGREGIRGMASFSLRNSALDARPYSLTGQTVAKPSYAQSRFGLFAGGPLRLPGVFHGERTFFTADFSGTRSRNPFNATATLPTLAERAGDFSQTGLATPPGLFDPANRLEFADHRLPVARLNSAALGLLDFIPLPNQPGLIQNYQYLTSRPDNSSRFGVRLNHSLSQRNSFQLMLNLQRRSGENAQLYGFRDETEGRGLNSNVSWTHNLRRRLINRVGWNFSRNRSEVEPFFAFGRNVAAELGIAGTSREPINFGPPNLSFTNFGGLTDASASLRRDQNSAVSETLTITQRQHNVTTGVEYRRTQLNSLTDQNARGTFSFSGLATSDFDARGLPMAGTGYDFADFLLGLPQSSSIRFGSSNTYFRGSVWSFYGQDDWRVKPNLTLNLGLRYEFFAPLKEKFGRIANLDVAPGFTGVAVVTPGEDGPYTGRFPEALIDPDKNNLSPRIGVAWRPFGQRHLQVRTGYGVFFNGSIYNQFPSRLASQPPFANTATLSTSLARPLTLGNGFATIPSTTITNTYAVDRGYRIGYAQTWNLSVQQDLPHSLVLEVGYLATKGTRLDIQRLPNRAAPGSPLTAEERRQIGNAVGFTFDSSEGNSIYHAAQVRLTRRFRRGMSGNVFYTWSKSIDNASTFGGGGAVVAQNDKDLAAERGLSSFDQRHTLTVSYLLASPVGRNAIFLRNGGWPVRLLEEWNLSGGVTAGSGQPLTARVLGNRADSGGTGSIGSGRADATGAPVDAEGRFFNLAAFMLPPAGRFGDAGRNTVPGPGTWALNLSLSRSFRLKQERRRLEVRVESQNLTNHVSFTNVGTVVNATNYGLPLATRPMRTMSASLRFRF